jgi:Lipoprotein LpqB beta-propeller domain
MTRRRPIAVLSVAALVLTACTGVPTTSAPQIVTPVGVARPSLEPAITPEPNADPRTMVLDFLQANALADADHANARGFLTTDANNRWSDTTVSVIDTLQVSNVINGSVTVSGRQLGSVSASGIYTPVLQGDSNSVGFAFGMKTVKGQWRIDTLAGGLILSYAAFQRSYLQREIYFYDRTEQRLVPDPRYSPLTDRSLLANWLVGQLVTGPRPELQNATARELPAQSDPRRVSVILGPPATIEVPGASKLDAATRAHLAAQLALTIDQVTPGAVMSILDGGRPVTISSDGATRFKASGFGSAVNPVNPSPALFYIAPSSGAVVDEQGKPLRGQLGTGNYHLTSVALASQPGSDDLLAAGTSGRGDQARLLVGSEQTGLRDTGLRGRLSRPSWAPGLGEVWVGVGSQVFRVTDGGTPTVVPVAGAATVTGRVAALRMSPDGSRVAMVLNAGDGSAQVWIGSIVRTPDQAQVRVDSLEPISPQAVAVTDVAWNDQLKLFTIGKVLSSGQSNVFEVQVDGSLWTPRNSTSTLPGPPDSITIAENVPAWVSVGKTVWVQSGGSWSSPDGETTGTNPTYLE